MKLSIVATLYQSASHLREFYDRVSSVAKTVVGEEYEIVLVNDGSPDDSLEIAVELTRQDDKVTLLDLSRNFGHHRAMMAGMKYASGERIFLIDSDLEEEPEWLTRFSQEMSRTDSDVVYGVQKSRKGGLGERLSGYLFYKVFRLLTGVAQPDNIVTARLMRRRYVDGLLLHSESEINIGGLWVITGFKQLALEVVKLQSSATSYSLRKKVSHLVNAVTSFSSAPLVLTFYTGLVISIFSSLFVLRLVIGYFFLDSMPNGYASLIASIWLLAGLIIFFIGIQGIYLSKIFSEVKNRPNVIVKQIYCNGTDNVLEKD